MRRFFAVALWLLLVYAVGSAKPAVWKDPDYGFSLEPPKGWTLSSSAGAQISMVAPSSENGFTPTINVMVQAAPGVTLEQYAEKSLAQADRYKGKLIAQKAVEAHGLAGHQLHMSANLSGRELEFLSTFYIYNNKVFLITATAVPANFKKFQPIFEANAKSFKL